MKRFLVLLLALMVALPAARAQERQAYTQAELDQMLAPVALYPDALLSQVLMASTYPLDVVEAARWARANPGLQGDEAVNAVAGKDWDPSVKSLVAFPNLLARMDEQLDWTKRLGDAFLAQEAQVMDTVQGLRHKARAAGQLAPDERVRVVEDGRTIVIEQANPRVVYVPYYDPWVVYGPWWWSSYPPVAWAPWPGYVAYRPGFWWGVGVGISSGFFFGGVDWHHRHVQVVRRPVHVHVHQRPLHVGKWQHDGWHRRGIERRAVVVERRGEVRPQPMPPAFRASNPQPQPRMGVAPERRAPQQVERRAERPAERRAERPAERRAEQPRMQPRAEQPRVARPEGVQPRMGVQQPQPRLENRGGGNGGGRSGGWREQAGRGNGRG